MIRKTKTTDLRQIESLMRAEERFWDKTWRSNVLKLGIESSNGLSFVYEENKRILGFVCAHDLGFRGYLSELIVSPNSRENNIGKILVRKVEQELKKKGCSVLIADVWKNSEKFYKKLGWREPDVKLLRKKL